MKILFFSVIAILFTLSSCSHYFYIPNAHNVPLFQEKGEIRAAATINDDNSTTDFQAAYAITNHFGIMANGFHNPIYSNPNFNSGGGYLVEAGAGYFTKLNRRWVFETYGGFGAGNVKNFYFFEDSILAGNRTQFYGGRSVMNLNRAFVQPSIGYTSMFFDCALSTRIIGIWYTNIRTYDVDENFFYANDMKLMRNNYFTQLEPALTIRAGWKYIKLQGQAGFSFNLNHPQFRYEWYNFNLGVYISIADKFKSKNP